ncbi:fasciclin domain-containing protein [Halalkalibaculum sp. DA3122]|uniref:fasciclin domain-containing protein n=1 Tax=unclassified Halalkalibaculum TaxID=2964617 RepID=UPI0037546292
MKKVFNILSTGLLVFTLAIGIGINNVQAQDDTVMEVVNSNNELSTFSELLAETQLPELLTQEGPFTVIAPTDEAFEKSGIDTDQLKENPDQLQNVVITHLFRGTLGSDEVEPNTGAPVKEGDVEASNGVVHVVENVVQPKKQN